MLHGLLGCYSKVTEVLQECYSRVTRVLQGCYKGVTRISIRTRHIRVHKEPMTSLVLLGCYRGVKVG
jgi:hypothetical protein